MPHTRSAKKNLRKTTKRRLRNRATIKTIKTMLKRFDAAIAEGTVEAAQIEYNLTAKKLDKAAARRIIHPNLAARKKSQMGTALHNKKKSAPPAPPATPTA